MDPLLKTKVRAKRRRRCACCATGWGFMYTCLLVIGCSLMVIFGYKECNDIVPVISYSCPTNPSCNPSVITVLYNEGPCPVWEDTNGRGALKTIAV